MKVGVLSISIQKKSRMRQKPTDQAPDMARLYVMKPQQNHFMFRSQELCVVQGGGPLNTEYTEAEWGF